MQRFTDKVILITGAARGIGLATVEQFALEGGTVVATDIDEDELGRSIGALAAQGHRVESVAHDVSDAHAWETVFGRIAERYGRLDVLVNNAGTGEFASLEDATLEQWRRTMAVNLEGVFLGMQGAVAAMKETGGAIVNVASIAANVAEPLLPAYAASKGGLRTLTKVVAVDCARRGYGIRVNSVHPGYADTKLVRDALESLGPDAAEFAEKLMQSVPMGRLADPSEIAKPIVFLASDDASFITGSELVVDGGYIAA